jgi:hypothetical protein
MTADAHPARRCQWCHHPQRRRARASGVWWACATCDPLADTQEVA